MGTGSIARSMARVVKQTSAAELTAVSSRRLSSAQDFAAANGASRAFDDWAAMAAWDGVDAIYIATPTSVREEIAIVAARSGKHVLAEKPFASAPSLQRIVAACQDNNVAFMDGTHFNHHPRTRAILERIGKQAQPPWSVSSAFQFGLTDRGNIRYNPKLEPMGALGDAGWYNMRAAATYLANDSELAQTEAFIRRDQATGAVIGASGVLVFDSGATSTWNCGFDSGAVLMDLCISSAGSVVTVDNFLSQNGDGSADYRWRQGGFSDASGGDLVNVASTRSSSTHMFDQFAQLVADPTLRQRSMDLSNRTQQLLDAAWASAIGNEKKA